MVVPAVGEVGNIMESVEVAQVKPAQHPPFAIVGILLARFNPVRYSLG